MLFKLLSNCLLVYIPQWNFYSWGRFSCVDLSIPVNMKTRVVSPRCELSYPSPPSSLRRFLWVALMSVLCFLQHCWVCVAAGRARQEALAPVEELVPSPIPLHPSPTPHTAGQHRWSPQQSGPVANLREAEKKEALSRGCGFQLSEFWPEGTQQRFVVFSLC